MRCAALPFDSQYMRDLTPFGAFLMVGAVCSAMVAGRAWLPTVAAQAEEPATVASAAAAPGPPHSYAVPTTVTEVQLPPPESAALAQPTPARAAPSAPYVPAPLDAVQALAAPVAADPGPLSSEQKSDALLFLMNAAREKEALAPLERDAALDEIALVRARDLVAREYFDHYGPDGSSAFSELAIRGWRYGLAGENLARNNYPGTRTVQAAFDGLMASPGHRSNILEERFAHVGIAAVQSGRLWVYVTVFTD